jgi:hypothetical protein
MTTTPGGVLLAIGHWVPGPILVKATVVFVSPDYFDKDDSSDLY